MRTKSLVIEDIVKIAIQSPEFKNNELDNIKLAKLAGFNDDEIAFVKLFWDPLFHKSWLYLSKQMVVDWLGYKDGKSVMNNFYTQNLIKNYEEYEDYKEVSKDDEIVKKFYTDNSLNDDHGNRYKYYVITGDCLKNLLMSAKTTKGKTVRKIYVKTDKLVFAMLEIIKLQQLMLKEAEIDQYKNEIKDKDNLLLELETKTLRLENKILNIKPYTDKGFIYLITNDIWQNSNMYRLGRADKLKQSITNYRIGRARDEKMYYVYVFRTPHSKVLEYILRNLLEKFRKDPKADQYILHSSILLPLVEKICRNFAHYYMFLVNNAIKENANIALPPAPLKRLSINDLICRYNISDHDFILPEIDAGPPLTEPTTPMLTPITPQTLSPQPRKAFDITRMESLDNSNRVFNIFLPKKPYRIEFVQDEYKRNNNDKLYKNTLDFVNNYNANLLTKKEDITKQSDKILIECAHKSWTTTVRAILKNAWNCSKCKLILKS